MQSTRPQLEDAAQPREFYGADLAAVHDEGFGNVARHAGLMIKELLVSLQSVPGAIVDIGCGSGILEETLGSDQRNLIGLDRSTELIKIARRRAPYARFEVGTLTNFQMPQACIVCAVNEVLNYVTASLEEAPFLFEFIDKALVSVSPGGYLLFDVAAPGRVPNGRNSGFVETEQWACLYRSEETINPPALTRHITVFRRTGEHFRRTQETHLQRLWSPDQVGAYLSQHGFEVQQMSAYGCHELPKNVHAFLARQVAPLR